MKAATCFSGIGAPEVALPQYEWIWHSEIDNFPNAVMTHHHPDSANLGDVLADDFIERARSFGPLDLMVGGPPCQAFSIAGLRQSLSDPRGNLSLRWVQVLHAIRPRNAITENVPGWLSTADNAFGCFLAGVVGADAPLRSPLEQGRWPDAGMVAGPRARAAWRILNAQHFGLAQRRRRVFVVIDFGNGGADPAAVLLERESLSWNSPPRREARQDVAPTISARTKGGGGLGTDFDCDGGLIASTGNVPHCLNAGGMGRIDYESETLITHALRGEGFDASEDGTGRGTPLVPVPIQSVQAVREKRQNGIGIGRAGDAMFTLTGRDRHAVAFSCKDHGADAGDIAPTLRTMGHDGSHANAGGQLAANTGAAVRRLTVRECERLQGFKDDYTLIPYRNGWAADGPRYKALGNSMAVPCMAWIGSRIDRVNSLLSTSPISPKGGANG